jgi:hypothetical protein
MKKKKKVVWGKKNLFFKVPDNVVDVMNIKIAVDEFSGKKIEKNIQLNIAGVDLQYEVMNAFRPPFYLGKSLAISNSSLKFYAFPTFRMSNGAILPPETLIYK